LRELVHVVHHRVIDALGDVAEKRERGFATACGQHRGQGWLKRRAYCSPKAAKDAEPVA
jgi:hypothetical protein